MATIDDKFTLLNEKELTAIIENTLIKGKLYTHDLYTGIIYEEETYKTPLIDVYKHTGEKSLGKPFETYEVSSGYNPINPQYIARMAELTKRKEARTYTHV